MLNEPTLEKLRALHLTAMAATWSTQREDPKIGELDFDARFGMLVDAEVARPRQQAPREIAA